MRIEEIITKRTLSLNEILDTRVDVKWRDVFGGMRGTFDLDDHVYEIQIDHFDLKLSKDYTFVDFGFTRDGDWAATHEQKSASRIFGAVINAFLSTMDKIQPSFVMYGVNYKNGSVESRKSLYDRLARYFGKSRGYRILYEWVKGTNGEYCLMTKEKLSEEDKAKLDAQVTSIMAKPIA